MNAAFDTLSASKRLRDAGVEERAADAIVELVQSATHFPDIGGLATKADIADMATATATKLEFTQVRHSIELLETRLRAELHDKLRVQTFALMGGMTAVVGLATAIIKLAP
uniref:DUF1640 domain-containing protein n=1 Tax=Caulobacter sp. (strain K31) TaxID=366602 RepID=B0T2L3_CAUSK